MKIVLAIGLILVGLCQTLTAIDLSPLKYLDPSWVAYQISCIMAPYQIASGETKVVECEGFGIRHVFINDEYKCTLLVFIKKDGSWEASRQHGPEDYFQVLDAPGGGFYLYDNKYTPTIFVFNTYDPNPKVHNVYTENYKRR